MANLTKTFVKGEVLKASDLNLMVDAINSVSEGTDSKPLSVKTGSSDYVNVNDHEIEIKTVDLSNTIGLKQIKESDLTTIGEGDSAKTYLTSTLVDGAVTSDSVEASAGQWISTDGTITTTGLVDASDIAAEIVADEKIIANVLNLHEDRIGFMEDNFPTTITETDVTGWGFTKNTGTYSKPTDGIPSTDLAESVQTSLGLADTALQSETYTGTVKKVNGVEPNALGDVTLTEDINLKVVSSIENLNSMNYVNKLVLKTSEPVSLYTAKSTVDVKVPLGANLEVDSTLGFNVDTNELSETETGGYVSQEIELKNGDTIKFVSRESTWSGILQKTGNSSVTVLNYVTGETDDSVITYTMTEDATVRCFIRGDRQDNPNFETCSVVYPQTLRIDKYVLADTEEAIADYETDDATTKINNHPVYGAYNGHDSMKIFSTDVQQGNVFYIDANGDWTQDYSSAKDYSMTVDNFWYQIFPAVIE